MVGRLEERMSANCHYVRGTAPSAPSIPRQNALQAARSSGESFSPCDRLLPRFVEVGAAMNEWKLKQKWEDQPWLTLGQRPA